MIFTQWANLFFFCMFLLNSCGGGSRYVNFGKTTRMELFAIQGNPISEESIPLKGGKILIYPDHQKFQLHNDLVTHGFRDPEGDEKNLIYWKHKFKDCNPVTQKISEPIFHEASEYEFKCHRMGLSVVYKDGSEFIERIIEYEKE
jgi:hypothetical protein